MVTRICSHHRIAALTLAACLVTGAVRAQTPERPAVPANGTVKVRLLAPLTSKFSRKGDLVSARILEPGDYQNGILEGEVREVKAGGAGGKLSYVQFDLRKLHLAGSTLNVNVALVSASNSQHRADVDEDGNAVELSSRGGAGKLVSSVFTPGSAPALKLNTKAPQVSFSAGSEFVLELQTLKSR